MASNKHALLSPSSSERWINCSGSFLLPQYNEERDTTAADEGSLVHQIAEYKLMQDDWYDYKSELDECRKNDLYDPVMEHYTDEYVGFILNKDYDTMLVEEMVDLYFIYPDLFGTADCILMSESNGIDVIDLKYGRYKVPVENNTQLLIYALGAVKLYQNKFPETKQLDNFPIRLTIYQPRIKNINTWEIDWKTLCEWNNKVLVPALSKLKFEVVEENPGKWCRFCKANIFCKEYVGQIMFDSETEIKPLNNLEIEQNLIKAEELEKYIKSVKSYITDEIKNGQEFNNFKLVAGRKSRYWNDEEQLKKVLSSNNELEAVLQLPTPAQLEKKLGKKNMSDYNQFISSKTGNPLLVKKEDRREELKFEN